MIFKHALQRELNSAAGAIFTVLFTIAITVRPIKILGMAANGRVDPNDVFILIGFAALNILPIILVLTGFIAVLMVMTRSYQDAEMVVWFASGMSLLAWIKPILRFAFPLMAAVGVFTFVISPLAAKYSTEYTDRFQRRSDIARITPGKFQESASRDRVFFVEGVAGDLSKVTNIFVNISQDNLQSIITAKEGETILDAFGDKFLVMKNGYRYDVIANQSEFRLMQFDRYVLLVRQDKKGLMANNQVQGLSTLTLLSHPTPLYFGELLWRLSLPIMAGVLMLLAIPLSYVNTRSGRSANFLLALFLSVTYYNLVLLSESWVSQQQISFILAWWPAHLIFIVLFILLLGWRLGAHSRYHPSHWWRKLFFS